MKLNKNLWISGGYYIDFDAYEQFRIIGPNNHLYCGLIDVPRHKITISSIKDKDNILCIKGFFNSQKINLYYPAMDDMRTVREEIGSETFLQIRKRIYDRLVPQFVRKTKKDGKTFLKFKRRYGRKYYQTIFEFDGNIEVKKIKKPFAGFKISAKSKKIAFMIKASTNDLNNNEIKKVSLINKKDFDFSVFGNKKELIERIWIQTEIEIKHLLEWEKTSGDRFGTIFPRDWMEAADIGQHDLTSEVKSYMYEESLKNVNSKGAGWHEDVVGEFKYEYEVSGKDILDRHMIDIEPHYLMNIEYLSQNFWLKKENRKKMHLVARYILKQAKARGHITFKKDNDTGNWRDSGNAFRRLSDIIAPFDVNAVFYPRALRSIKNNYKEFGFKNNEVSEINKIYHKWKNKRDEYKFKNEDGTTAYALALYGVKNKENKFEYKKMELNHIDESYLYTYCEGSKEELESFCERLLNPDYFYTKSGPLLVAKKSKYFYTPQEYHGLVIWIKQTAFVVLGLSKHLKLSIIEGWPVNTQRTIKKTILKITENTLNAIEQMESIPEVYADIDGKPIPYHDLTGKKDQGSEVQLWSAVGIRRIIRKYYELLTDEKYEV
ncbi:MAG: hypothetical protein KAQ87_05525 [Candidatus Pacebacteria bacterium]|nr:hypothetical protein [Candidatus Paceibacterota bacterium]